MSKASDTKTAAERLADIRSERATVSGQIGQCKQEISRIENLVRERTIAAALGDGTYTEAERNADRAEIHRLMEQMGNKITDSATLALAEVEAEKRVAAQTMSGILDQLAELNASLCEKCGEEESGINQTFRAANAIAPMLQQFGVLAGQYKKSWQILHPGQAFDETAGREEALALTAPLKPLPTETFFHQLRSGNRLNTLLDPEVRYSKFLYQFLHRTDVTDPAEDPRLAALDFDDPTPIEQEEVAG